MRPPVRDQSDIGTINQTLDASDGATVDNNEGADTENKDVARQEFKDEADINFMLSKFNITQPRNAPIYGEWDDTIDLQIALEAVREARAGYRTLPKEVREKFRSMEEFLTAVDNGSLVIKPEEPAADPAAANPA